MRGIKICDNWSNDFKAFYDWAVANGYNDNLTIERINVNGNYEPNNCCWILKSEQAKNRRNNNYITYNFETHTIADWAKILNVSYTKLYLRIKRRNWSIERAFNTP